MILTDPTCVPGNPVEHFVPHAHLELPLDLVEVRYPTIMHELRKALGAKSLSSIIMGKSTHHELAIRPWMTVVQAESSSSSSADMGTAQRIVRFSAENARGSELTRPGET